MKKLYDFQKKGIDLIRKSYSKSNRILVQSPTGSGKTEIIFHLINGHKKAKKKSLFVVRRRQIVFQTVRRMIASGLTEVGTIMAGTRQARHFPIQVCSIDTITSYIKKGDVKFLREFDAVFIDEAHDSTSDSYRSFIWWLEGKRLTMYNEKDFLELRVKKKYFGFTATPYAIGKKTHFWWERCVVVSTSGKLRDLGFLCNAKTYIPLSINTTNLAIMSTGDYNQAQLYNVSSDKKVMGKIIDEYCQKGECKPAICFAVNKKHSMEIARNFTDFGIEAMHVEDTTDQQTRDLALNKVKESFYSGKPFVLCNVNIFSTGMDLPELTVGIMARPTESKVLWFQQIGRMLRICKGKEKAIIIDHGGNSLRFGDPFTYHPPDMRDVPTQEESKKISICPVCFYYHDRVVSVCEGCGCDIKESSMSLLAGQERIIEKDESMDMESYDAVLFSVMKDYVDTNVRYALEMRGKSEKDSWDMAYKRFGKEFIKNGLKLGCPDYVIKSLKKKTLTESLKNSKVLFA